MNPLDQLSEYLRRIERSLRWLTITRGAALLFGTALVVTLALVFVMNQLAFSAPSVFYARLVLFFCVAAALSLGVIVPLLRLNTKRSAKEVERRFPSFGERLMTFVERRSLGDPFLPLLASDTLPYAAAVRPSAVAAPSLVLMLALLAAATLSSLVWLGTSGPGYLSYGTNLLWGASPSTNVAFYSIEAEPGNHRVRRHADQIVTARLKGFYAQEASLFARYASATKWEETAMRPASREGGFQFLFVGLPEDVEYYVTANGVRSGTFKLTAVDLPAVTHLRVTYRYPAVYGRKDEVEDPGGDLRAIEGTEARLEITTDKPLSSGLLVFDDGSKIDLAGDGVQHSATVPIRRDGTYHIAVPDSGEIVRLSDDYFIEARRDSPPVISILKPGRDARATPIEEVPVTVQARDDIGVLGLELHYSVNGGPDQTVALPAGHGVQDVKGTHVLALEDFKLVPGDIVSVYAATRDAKTTVRSDILFIQARPFAFNYTQDQSSGSGAGGEQDTQVSEREKEIIAATWNQLKDTGKKASGGENARYLAEVQTQLRDQAQSLATRMKSRQLGSAGGGLQAFIDNMDAAIAQMEPAANTLRGQKWKDALSPEQKALQYLLRAEALSRDIRVSMDRNGGGGSGSKGATRDLEGLASLELDAQKNQYENGQRSSEDQQQKEIDDTLKKLEELARRQQQLAQQNTAKQNFQQRWEQEMLRREAEEARRKLEELSRNQQKEQGKQQGQEQAQQGEQKGEQKGQQPGQQQGQQATQGRQGGRGQGSSQQRSLESALEQLSEATREMGQAASKGSQPEAQRAAERLNEARSSIAGMRRQQNGNALSDLTKKSQRLAERQSSFDDQMRRSFGGEEAGKRSDQETERVSKQMQAEKQSMIDEYKALESGMQKAARGLQNTQPEAGKRMRDALGAMQQEEVENRMRWAIEALRRNMGNYAVMREAPVTRSLNELKDRLKDAESAMSNGQSSHSSGMAAGKLQQALERAQRLREKLQQSPGEGGVGEARGELRSIQQSLRSDPQLSQELGKIEGDVARMDRRSVGDPARLESTEQKLLAAAEQMELLLRRRLDESQNSIRTPAPQQVPPGYQAAVAEYFRRLSH